MTFIKPVHSQVMPTHPPLLPVWEQSIYRGSTTGSGFTPRPSFMGSSRFSPTTALGVRASELLCQRRHEDEREPSINLTLANMNATFTHDAGNGNSSNCIIPALELHDASPTRINRIMNGAPRCIKEQFSKAAIDLFKLRAKARGFDFDNMVKLTEQRFKARGDNTLSAYRNNFEFPDYYGDENAVHFPVDGTNNGYMSAIQAPAAHEGLYFNNEEVRATVYDPAISSIKQHLKTNTECRIIFAGSGFGGDVVDFLARVKDTAPELLSKLCIQVIDLSPQFLDIGADEIPNRLNKLGIESGKFERFTHFDPALIGASRPRPNDFQMGYHNFQGAIKGLHFMDISAPDFVASLRGRGVEDIHYVFCLYTFHEMPESRIRDTMANFLQLGEHVSILFQDMHYQKKIEHMKTEGLQGQLKSLLMALVFSGTEPFSNSPPSQQMPLLLAEYGVFIPFNQTDLVREEATIQAGVIESHSKDCHDLRN